MCAAWRGCREIRDRYSRLTLTGQGKRLRVLSREKCPRRMGRRSKTMLNDSYVNFAKVVGPVKPCEGRMLRCVDLYSSGAAFAPFGRCSIMVP